MCGFQPAPAEDAEPQVVSAMLLDDPDREAER
jgi:hypothetical protein